MSPRPPSPERSEFEPALEIARALRFAEAYAEVERVLAASEPRGSFLAAAALAMAEIARLAERERDVAAAEQALARAVELRPRFADLQHRYACVLIVCGRPRDARRALERALAVNPRYVAARLELALLDARDGMIGEAVDALRVLSEDSRIDDPRAFQQGMRSLEQADWEGADAKLRRALSITDDALQRRLEAFHERMRDGDSAGAAAVLREEIPRHESYPDLHFLLGTAELRLGHLDDALASLGRALELQPEFHDARMAFAHALDALGRHAEAVDQVQAVIHRDPGHAEARNFLAANDRRAGRRL